MLLYIQLPFKCAFSGPSACVLLCLRASFVLLSEKSTEKPSTSIWFLVCFFFFFVVLLWFSRFIHNTIIMNTSTHSHSHTNGNYFWLFRWFFFEKKEGKCRVKHFAIESFEQKNICNFESCVYAKCAVEKNEKVRDLLSHLQRFWPLFLGRNGTSSKTHAQFQFQSNDQAIDRYNEVHELNIQF